MKLPVTYSEVFDQVLDSPIQYVRHNSVQRIKSFLDGYKDATRGYIKNDLYSGFNEWVADKFGVKTAHSWELIVCLERSGELESLELTKKLWQEYKNTQKLGFRVGSKLVVDEMNVQKLKASDLIEIILEKPGLFLGHESVPRMRAFLDGYRLGCIEVGCEEEDPLFEGFQDWVVERFHKDQGKDWEALILFMGLSEAGAFKLARELWAEYRMLDE